MRPIKITLVIALMVLSCQLVFAQFLAEQMAVTSGMNELNATAVGPGPGMMPGMMNEEAMMMGMGMPGMMPGGGMPGFPGQQVQGQQPVVPQIPKMKVLEGTRIICAVTGTILEEPRIKEIDETDENKSRYYNDGQTGGDYIADDDVYTNVDIDDRSYISAEAAQVRTKLIRLLRRAEKESAGEFFMIPAMSTDPISALPKTYEKEDEKDKKLSFWRQKFLSKFRKDPDDPDSEFLPVYVPKPPDFPSISLQTQGNVYSQQFQEGMNPEFMGQGINEYQSNKTPIPLDDYQAGYK